MPEYTHEMRWRNHKGEVGNLEYYYNVHNRTVYLLDGRVVTKDHSMPTGNYNSRWMYEEIIINLENK